ncbi:MAG TPA: S-layer homology domain-containing protein [Candidatus Butyricicoccus avistercoris]|uniref:S-layer homology domain-containing protein n=1 Tax=Candidatus Butyricicoccus avistercoris TaxID=2838518 RepID=A0A9D1PJI5_9FIRM|nr:S-layer homology domain-containing protein [Candidatus Butyricicoccus avistercoris]
MKTNIGKALVTSTLIASMAIGTTAYASLDLVSASKSVYADNVAFTDLSGYSWAEDAINSMASQGILNGVGNGMFAPKSNVTRQEFAAMAIRAFGGENKVHELAVQMSEKAEAEGGSLSSLSDVIEAYGENNWSNETMVATQAFPDIAQLWSCRLSDWKQDATRAEMAFILMTIAEDLGDETFNITDGINTVIGDFSTVSASQFASSITKAYSNGILVGMDNQGNYKPNNLSTRAEAAVIMQRLVDPSKREEVKVDLTQPDVEGSEGLSPLPDGSNIGVYTQAVYPKEGDIINGVKVTRDPVTGVLGYGNGQKGGIYLGIQEKNADGSYSTIEVGTVACEKYDGMVMGDTYIQRYDYVYWGVEWAKIDQYAMSRLPQASASTVGAKADINGDIIAAGDTTTPAFWECRYDSVGGFYQWYKMFNN